MAPHNDLVFYHYTFSPFARKVGWYLTLRGIDHAECAQPITLPRPDLQAIGVNYRRIPVLAHGNDVYCDTRLIQDHLDATFPASAEHPGLAATSPAERAYAHLLQKWTVEAGIFMAAVTQLNPSLPVFKDARWLSDRKDFTGSEWGSDIMARSRAPGAVIMRDAFAVLEEQILGDGRDWVLGGSAPSRADIDTVWPFDWLSKTPGSLDKNLFSPSTHPKTFAWIKRFNDAVKAAAARGPKPAEISGDEAAKQILAAKAWSLAGLEVDPKEPLGLKKGQLVESYPTDSGFNYKDKGKLVGINTREVVMQAEAPGGKTVHIHHPRLQFKVKALDGAKL